MNLVKVEAGKTVAGLPWKRSNVKSSLVLAFDKFQIGSAVNQGYQIALFHR